MALEEKKDGNGKSGGLLAALVVGIVLILGGGFFLLQSAPQPVSTPAEGVQEEEAGVTPPLPSPDSSPTTTAEEPPQPSVPENPVVVETKTLAVPGAGGQGSSSAVAARISSPEVEAMMAPRTIGSDSAPIKVVEYSSLTCGHCAMFHKETLPRLKEEFVATGKVQFTFREFPLNEPALVASQVLRCMSPDKYEGFMSLLFSQQESWAHKPEFKDILRQNAKLAGLSDAQVDSCYANEELKARLVADMQAATAKYNIQSTPTFIVNDGAKVIVGHQPVKFFEDTFAEILKAAPDSGSAPAPEQ